MRAIPASFEVETCRAPTGDQRYSKYDRLCNEILGLLTGFFCNADFEKFGDRF
jgi:hypothetical protein